ncbi:MAG: hypothetical protein M1815_005276 [Lichina confinis]|nr:MAG: hypothetical protein M1815_005276 [Lichina confinis]
MGGANLEIFKFGMYIMFPIGIMYYFGTNLENRFSVPDFWPKASECNRIPFDRDELREELNRMKTQRLDRRARRLQREKAEAEAHADAEGHGRAQAPSAMRAEAASRGIGAS